MDVENARGHVVVARPKRQRQAALRVLCSNPPGLGRVRSRAGHKLTGFADVLPRRRVHRLGCVDFGVDPLVAHRHKLERLVVVGAGRDVERRAHVGVL